MGGISIIMCMPRGMLGNLEKIYCFHHARFIDVQETHRAQDYNMLEFLNFKEKSSIENITFSAYVTVDYDFEFFWEIK